MREHNNFLVRDASAETTYVWGKCCKHEILFGIGKILNSTSLSRIPWQTNETGMS